jgi:hypothetical protein
VNSPPPIVWRPGGQSEVQLVGTHGGWVTAERRAVLNPIRDTARIVVTVDSLVSDSVFGEYRGDLSHCHVAFGAVGPESQLVRGRVVGSQFHLVLTAYVTEASLELT